MAIDLSEVIFRAHEIGDVDEDKSIPALAGSPTTKIILSSIKFRAKEIGDAEE